VPPLTDNRAAADRTGKPKISALADEILRADCDAIVIAKDEDIPTSERSERAELSRAVTQSALARRVVLFRHIGSASDIGLQFEVSPTRELGVHVVGFALEGYKKRASRTASISRDRAAPSHNLATSHFTARNGVAPTKDSSAPGAEKAPLVVFGNFADTEPLGVPVRNIPS
jgi:hypothetical protein